LFLFLFFNNFEHWVGKRVARLPNIHIEIKIDPIKGFLQRKFSDDIGGNSASISTRNNPRTAIKI
jgi:hypothetical protein